MNNQNFVDLSEIMRNISTVKQEDRLSVFMEIMGCKFYDEEKNIVLEPSVNIHSIGGLSIKKLMDKGLSLNEILTMTKETMGNTGGYSYLGLPGGNSLSAYAKIAGEHKHFSIAHSVNISLTLSGITCAVENEFNTQRDLVHLARITEARTKIQNNPPLVAHSEEFAKDLVEIRKYIEKKRQKIIENKKDTKDNLEMINLMWPACKATCIQITGSLRNFQKILSAEFDEGKEKEYRKSLTLIRTQLGNLYPELFPNPEYKYENQIKI